MTGRPLPRWHGRANRPSVAERARTAVRAAVRVTLLSGVAVMAGQVIAHTRQTRKDQTR